MTSCFQKNGFGSNGIDSLGCWHVEPHWRLVHISDVDQTVVLLCVERYTGRYEFYIAPNFVAVHNHRFMRLSNNKRIVSTVRNLMII